MEAKTCLLREMESLQENTFWLCNRHGQCQTTVWVHVKSEGGLHKQAKPPAGEASIIL